MTTGIDMLNPLDPTEGMDLAAIKERYGDRLTLVGGIDRHLLDLSLDEIESRLQSRLEIGAEGGRFVVMDACGIPEDMSIERFNALLGILRRVRATSN